MTYGHLQLELIEKNLIRLTENEKTEKDGLRLLLNTSEFLAWASHAQLAGYYVDQSTGRIYRQEGNVRTYLE